MAKPWKKMTMREKKDLFHEWTALYMEVHNSHGKGFMRAFSAFKNTHPEWVEEIRKDPDAAY